MTNAITLVAGAPLLPTPTNDGRSLAERLGLQRVPGTCLFTRDGKPPPTPAANRPGKQPTNQAAAAAEGQARAAFQATLQKFVTQFGVQCGTRYAAEGLTFEQAIARHDQYVAAVRRCGEIWAADDARRDKQSQLTPAIGAGAASFAARLKLPQ